MTVDANGQTVVMTLGRLAAFTERGRIAWSREITSRPFDDSTLDLIRSWSLAGEPTTGDFVLSTDVSTAIDSTRFLQAIVTSKFSADGELLWTVRHESPEADLFLSHGLAVEEDDVFVLGSSFDTSETYARSALVRHIVDTW